MSVHGYAPGSDTEKARGDEEVSIFTSAMLRELDANLYKGAWLGLGWTRRAHFREIDYHVAKVKAAVRAGDAPERILEFCADIANHAMFLADHEEALSYVVQGSRARESSFVKPCVGVYWRLLRNVRWVSKGWGGLRNPVAVENHEPDDLPAYKPGNGTNIF